MRRGESTCRDRSGSRVERCVQERTRVMGEEEVKLVWRTLRANMNDLNEVGGVKRGVCGEGR